MSIVEVKDLSKHFRTLNRHEGLSGTVRDLFSRDYKITKAVDGISFSIDEGEVVGFVGPNGAGKSTTVKMLTGVLEPTSGTILVGGLVPYRNRARNAKNIGVVFGQRTQLWWDLPVIESFKVLKEIYRIGDAQYAQTMATFSSLVDLTELYPKQVRTMSLGQRMLCDIIASFLHNPRMIFLDEPTIGLDISVKSRIRTIIKELNAQRKTTIILTTHDISDIEALCKRIIVIDKGKIIFDDSITKVATLVGAYRTLRVSFGQSAERDYSGELLSRLSVLFPVEGALSTHVGEDGWVSLVVSEDKLKLMDVLNAVTSEFPVKDIKVEEIETESVIKKIYEGALL
jgi:ABC-2 type transport system ATP-binding protein